ncbi:MAG: tol-pal system protein YbgF [Alphaproteobacteria bacterium]|nr:tol-pal system protein YbgF [Alphaproteobacteria bacterium]
MRLGALSVAVLAAPLMALALAASPASAQSDVRPLLDRLDRVEREMMTLQRQVYRGSSGASSTSSGAAQSAAPVVGDSSDAVIALQERLDRMEAEMRRMTGRMEELGHAQSQNSQRLERMAKDYDLRFSEIERKQSQEPAQAGAGPVPQHNPPPELMAQPQAKPGEETIVLKPPAGATTSASPAGETGKSGTLQPPSAAKPPPPAGTAVPPAQTAAPSAPATPAKPQDAYDKALGLLRGGDYDGAEKAFSGFIQANPKDALAGNAQYWLGETYYVRGDHQKAAVAFAEGYQKYPNSSKAADNLLKLGLSLDALGQKKEACTSYARLLKEYKTVATADAAKRKATSETQRLGCK